MGLRFRLRVSTLLVIVASIGVGIVLERMRGRFVYCRAVVDRMRAQVALYPPEPGGEIGLDATSIPRQLTLADRSAFRSRLIRQQRAKRLREFEAAMINPWLPVPPGPSDVARPDF